MIIKAPCENKEADGYKSFSNTEKSQKTINFFNNQLDSYSTNSNVDLVGGKDEEWEQILENISQSYIKQKTPHQDVEKMGEHGYVKRKLGVEKLENPYILDPSKYKKKQELFDAITHWWIFKRRKNKNTVKKRITIAKRMSRHSVFPINWNELNPNQTIAYLEHREYKEGAGKNAIRNEWDTINMFAKAYGINIESWGYIPPSKPPAKVKIIPLPNTTHNIIHHKYSKDKYTNALYQYILMHGFVIGWRPSEIVIQKLSDVNIEDGYMIITETKKHSQLRQIFPEIDLMNNLKRKCLKNWVEKWRPKVENQYSKDFLYLQPNGKPYTVNYLRKKLTPLVKEVWRPFSLYTMRHWCATARLIKSKMDTKKWDIWEVKDWMGHDKIDTTEDYVKYAKKYYRNAPFDWIKSVLKYHKKMVEENGHKSINGQKTLLSSGTNRSGEVRTWRDSNPRPPT